MLLFRLILVVAFNVSLLGCAWLTTTDPDYVPWNVTPEVGSYVQLNQELTASRGKRIYIQDGEAKPKREINDLEPYCQFYVDRKGAAMREPLAIAEDRFIIKDVFRRKDFAALAATHYASFGDDMDFDPSPSQRTMSTYMEIFSDRQPQVIRLICSRFADPDLDNHVRLDEIKATLGEIVAFVPAG